MLNQTEFSRHYYDTTATLDEWVPETFTGKEGGLPLGL